MATIQMNKDTARSDWLMLIGFSVVVCSDHI